MPGTSLRSPTKATCLRWGSVRAWGAAWPAPVSLAALLLVGCQSTGTVDRTIFDPHTPVADRESFHKGARMLSKSCANALAEEKWDTIAADSKRLELLAQRWDEYPPKDAARIDPHRAHAKALHDAAVKLTAAAATRDLPAASAAYGLAAERVGKLRQLDPLPPPAPAPPPRPLPDRDAP